MKKTAILLLLSMTTICMGFDPDKFAVIELDHNDCTQDIRSLKIAFQVEHPSEDHLNRLATDLQNYYAVTMLSEVKYSIKVDDTAGLYGRKLFSDATHKALEKDIRNLTVTTLGKYGINEAKSTTPDTPLIEIKVDANHYPQVMNVMFIETTIRVRRKLLDPASKRPFIVTVWEDNATFVYTKKYPHLLVTKEHPDLIEKIIKDVDARIWLLAWSQYRSITTMKAAIQLDKEGFLPVRFSEYMIR